MSVGLLVTTMPTWAAVERKEECTLGASVKASIGIASSHGQSGQKLTPNLWHGMLD